MTTSLVIPFSKQDQRDLAEFKEAVSPEPKKTVSKDDNLQRHIIEMPEIEVSTESAKRTVEDALETQKPLPRGKALKLPPEIVEGAKAAFISSGGNLSEVAALYDLTAEAVLRLANQEQWPVYDGTTKLHQSKSKNQLLSLQAKLWSKIEVMLDSMDIETKAKDDLTQHRAYSEYVEPLASRSSAFKTLMDQYMRVSTLLEPEIFSDDPDAGNYHARKAKAEKYAGGIEGVNREIADFFSQVVVGIADRIADKDMKGYGGTIIDGRVD